MKNPRFPFLVPLLLCGILLALGCNNDKDGGTNPDPGPMDDERVSDFSLLDVNPNSTTYEESVSPRDYLEQVSAWYFGHAT
jgi:hypothetical protein